MPSNATVTSSDESGTSCDGSSSKGKETPKHTATYLHNLKIKLSHEEEEYRKKNFSSIEDLRNKQVRCTSCAKELHSRVLNGSEIRSHPILGVLLCRECFTFYGDGNFSIDEDGTDKYCRWCGQGGTLYCCANCTCAFCKACIKRNLQRSVLKDIESEDWKCFICYSKPLWLVRAICWVSQKYSSQIRREQRMRNIKALQKIKEKKLSASSPKRSSKNSRNMRSGTKEMEVINIDSESNDSCTHNKGSVIVTASKLALLSEAEENDIQEGGIQSACKKMTGEKDNLSSEDEDNFLSSHTLSRKNAGKISKLLSSQLQDFINIGEIISDQAKKMLRRKINKKILKQVSDVKKIIEKMEQLAQLSVQNIEKAETKTKASYRQWFKSIKAETTIRLLQDKTDCVTDKCQQQEDGSSGSVNRTLDENKSLKNIKNVIFSDHSDKENEINSPLSPDRVQGCSTPVAERENLSENHQGDYIENRLCASRNDSVSEPTGDVQSDKQENEATGQNNEGSDDIIVNGAADVVIGISSVNTDVVSNMIAETPVQETVAIAKDRESPKCVIPGPLTAESEMDKGDSKYLEISSRGPFGPLLESADGHLMETADEGLLETADERLLETADDHLQETADVDSDTPTEIFDICSKPKVTENSKCMNPAQFPAESEVFQNNMEKILSSHDGDDKLCFSEEQLNFDVGKVVETILGNVEENIESSKNKDGLGNDLKDNIALENNAPSPTSIKEKPFSSVSLKNKELLLNSSSEECINNSDGEAHKRKRKLRTVSSKGKLCQPDACANKQTGKKKKYYLPGLLSCSSDTDSEHSIRSNHKKVKIDFLERYTDEKLKNGCFVLLQRINSLECVDHNVNKETLPDKEIRCATKKGISQSEGESMDDNEEEQELRRLLTLKSLKNKSVKIENSSSDESKNKMSVPKKKKKLKKKLIKKETETLEGVHKKVRDGLLYTDTDDDEHSIHNSNGDDASNRKKEKNGSALIPNNIAKQLLLQETSSSDSSDSLHQEDKICAVESASMNGEDTKTEKECEKVEKLKGEQSEGKEVGEKEENGSGNEESEKNSKSDVGEYGDQNGKKSEKGETFSDSENGKENEKKENIVSSVVGEVIVKEENIIASDDGKEENEKENDSHGSRNENKNTGSTEQEGVEQGHQSQEENKKSMSENEKSAEELKGKKSKKNWRNKKLLRAKLSETDTSDEERWKARMAKKQEEDSSSRKKKLRVLGSDSDKMKSSSESSDLEDVFDMRRKRKHKSESSEIDSKSSSASSVELKKKPKRRRIKVASGSSSSDDEDLNSTQKSEGTPGKGRRNIRRVLKDENVAEATKRAAREEEERKKRIIEKQKLYNELYKTEFVNEEKLLDKLVLDFDPETKEEMVTVHKDIATKLKPHQVKGVKFMWDTCFESLEQIKKSKGTGCILAHCMGLGKTLQVVALVHTILSHSTTGMKTVLIICPYSTIKNWVNEFNIWLKDMPDSDEVEVYELTKFKKNFERMYQLKRWHEGGGVMMMGYEMYRNLTGTSQNARKKLKESFQETLVDPGPDLIVCDEGHLLRNEKSAISKSLCKIKTLRRIVLTGTPLQNNLNEYHCMVQFVKPNLLGTKKEFDNRFVNPIRNGQYVDSTLHDVKIMKRRAHVLHKMLESSVQRFDYGVLTPFLPPKQEYVISVRLSETQVKLYRYYLQNLSGAADGGYETLGRGKGAKLFADFQALQRIWTHPRVLLMDAERKEKHEEKKQLMASDTEGSLADFVVDETNSENSDTSNESSTEEVDNKKQASSDSDIMEVTEENKEDENKKTEEWWKQFIVDEDMENLQCSGKLMLLFYLLQECEKIGDKVLVFSQSLLSLDLIEYFLGKIDDASQQSSEESSPKLGGFEGSWTVGLDYFRLDGSTSAENRNIWCRSFNRETNHRARLFLISTKAGGLGINLVAANRVVLFDASWNPSQDVQSIFRIYRFGQKKPCYVYRFLAQGTMEEKVYDRQVTKLSLSCRVVDEQQIERHYNMADLHEMYSFDPEQVSKRPTPMLPKDRLLAEMLKEHEFWVVTYHEHDSLLQNKEEEELNEEERKAAWEEYENEKQGKLPQPIIGGFIVPPGGPLGNITAQGLKEVLQRQHPQATDDQLNEKLRAVIANMTALVSRTGGSEYERYLQTLQNQYAQYAVPGRSDIYQNTAHSTQLPTYLPYAAPENPNFRNYTGIGTSVAPMQPVLKVKSFAQMPNIISKAHPQYILPKSGKMVTIPNAQQTKISANNPPAAVIYRKADAANNPESSVQNSHKDDSIEIID